MNKAGYFMRFLLTFFLGIIINHVAGQKVFSSVANGTAYILHNVKKGEGAYGISRIYNAGYDAFLKENGLEKDAVLQEGMQLKIPLTGILKKECKGENCLPVYYLVQQSEGLYRIGKNHGDMKVAAIKELNHLKSESVSIGQELFMGYILVSDKDVLISEQTAPAGSGVAVAIETQAVPEPQKADTKADKPAEVIPSKNTPAKKTIGDSSLLTFRGKSFFETSYKEGPNKQILKASTFKSESGWNDGKYYALVDGIDQGFILKVKNTINNAVIYVKIVGPLPHVKNAENIKIRISSAGMMALGFFYDDLYDLEINY
jgi:LysM repeat protein